MSTHEVPTQVPDEPKSVNDLPRTSIPLFRTGTLPEDQFTHPATAPHLPEAIPETLPDDEIVCQAVGYFRTATRMDRTMTLLRYHGAKGLLVVQQRQKVEKGWMAFCEAEGLSYWTLRNAFRLAEEVDKAIVSGTFTLEELADCGWNQALRKFGVKSAKGGEESQAVDSDEDGAEAPESAALQPRVATGSVPTSEKPKSKRPAGGVRKRGKRQTQTKGQNTTHQAADGEDAQAARRDEDQQDRPVGHLDEGRQDEAPQAEGQEQTKLPCLAHTHVEKQFGLAYSPRELLYQAWFILQVVAGRVGSPDSPQEAVVQWDTMIPEMQDFLKQIEDTGKE